MIFDVTFDFFKTGVPNFGINQLAGFIVSTMLVLMGLRKIEPLRSRNWDRLLLLIYLAGILFMGLRPINRGFNELHSMLQVGRDPFSDVAENILGFFPLGYLIMLYFFSIDRIQKKIPVVFLSIATCIGISLLIESSQYYIPGRDSSLMDVLTNGLGAFAGTIFCFFEKRFSRND